ncbi:MAG TPA: hypothetical protein VK875_04375, partial [Euzebyales bacterium]|nr:hypothetical protein [Euzebyales bacterium]
DDRRAQRRSAADARRRTQRLRNDLAAAEAELEAAESHLHDVERSLADPRTYDDPEVIRELTMTHALARDRAERAGARWEHLVGELDRVTTEPP